MTYSLVTGTQANTSIERLLTAFAGTDANRFLNRKDEYLSVAEVSGSCSLNQSFDHLLNRLVFQDNCKFDAGFKLGDLVLCRLILTQRFPNSLGIDDRQPWNSKLE